MGKIHFFKVGRTVAVSMVALLCSFIVASEFFYLPADADEDIVVQIVAHRGYSGAYPDKAFQCSRRTVWYHHQCLCLCGTVYHPAYLWHGDHLLPFHEQGG